MQIYELMYIVPAKVEEPERNAAMQRVAELISSVGGSVQDHAVWMTRKLSYPINHIRQGVFILAHCTIPGDQLQKVKREMELDEDILRHILVKSEPHKQRVSKPQTQKVLPQEVVKQMSDDVAVEQPGIPESEAPSKEKVSLEELDQKLEELLGDDDSIAK